MTDVISKAKREGQKRRLATLHDLDAAAMRLVETCLPLLDETVPDAEIRENVFAQVSPTQLRRAIEVITLLTRPKGESYRVERIEQHRRVHPFLRPFLQTLNFKGTPDGEPVLRALAFLRSIVDQKKPNMAKAPRAVIPRSWRHLVITDSGEVDRRAYTMCVLEQLQDRRQRRDVFISPSERWGDPRLKLLRGAQWQALKPQVCRSLGRHPSAEPELERLSEQLDACYRNAMAALPNNPDLRIERVKGHDRLVVTPLDKLEEPPSLIELREAVGRLLPRVDLPEALLEIEARTGFATAFTHVSERNAAIQNFPTSMCAALMAEACNTGLEPVVRSDIPALTRSRLSWVGQNYIRHETIVRANAKLVNDQATLPLARQWGWR